MYCFKSHKCYNRTKKDRAKTIQNNEKTTCLTSIDVAGVPRGFDGLMELCGYR